MKNFKHTKWEWEIQQITEYRSKALCLVTDENNNVIANTLSLETTVLQEEAEANAKLIAAAPMLL